MPQANLKEMFGVDDETASTAQDILRPWENLVPIRIQGREVRLPENNSLWRGLQFWGLMTGEVRIDFGRFCIAGTCERCKFRIRRPGCEERESVLACQTQPETGMEIVKLAEGFSFRPRS